MGNFGPLSSNDPRTHRKTNGMDAFKHDVLSGKVAFIVGAASGINPGIAQHFAQHGAKVALEKT